MQLLKTISNKDDAWDAILMYRASERFVAQAKAAVAYGDQANKRIVQGVI